MTNELVMAAAIFLIFPELLGLLVVHFTKKEKYDLGLALVVGYLIEFGILEILSVITVLKVYSIIWLVQKFLVITGVLSILSIIVNFRSTLNILKEFFKSIKETPKILAIIVILLIGVQVYFPAKYGHTDEDDSYYVGAAVTAMQTNTLFRYDAYTGAISTKISAEHAIAPFLVYYILTGVLLEVHPTVAAHLILPVVLIILVYIAYFQVGKELFDDRKKAWLFLLFMCIINIFGNFSNRTNFTFLLFRIWQGKAMMANFALPLAILFVMKVNKNDHKFIYYLLLMIASFGSTLTTTMAIGFVPITIMLLGLSFEIAEHKNRTFFEHIKIMIAYLICCIPNLLVGVEYILIKK